MARADDRDQGAVEERDKWRLAIRKCWSPPCPEIALVRDGAGWWWCDKHQADHAADNPDSPFHQVEERITHASLTAAIAAHLARRRDEPAGERDAERSAARAWLAYWRIDPGNDPTAEGWMTIPEPERERFRRIAAALTDRRAAEGLGERVGVEAAYKAALEQIAGMTWHPATDVYEGAEHARKAIRIAHRALADPPTPGGA